MSAAPNRLILDADGVFLDERPYWKTALATALVMNDLDFLARPLWKRLADVAFGPFAVQCVTKRRGCNSNWDLAAVLARALCGQKVREIVAAELRADRPLQAMAAMKRGAEALWRKPDSVAEGNGRFAVSDPLLGFGLVRRERQFRDVVARFQRVLSGPECGDWPFARGGLKETRRATCAAFDRCRELNYELWVCTGRHRREIVRPLEQLNLGEYLPACRIVSGDEVERAEEATGLPSLGKPHWFAPACAAVGFHNAVEAVRGERPATTTGSIVYAGDAVADFRAVSGCRNQGLLIAYAHVRSGVTTPEQESQIAAASATLGVIDRLGELPALLGRLGR